MSIRRLRGEAGTAAETWREVPSTHELERMPKRMMFSGSMVTVRETAERPDTGGLLC